MQDGTGMKSGAVLVETAAPSMAEHLLGTNASFRKSKLEKHFRIRFSLLKFTRQMLPQKGTYLAQVSVGGKAGLPTLG